MLYRVLLVFFSFSLCAHADVVEQEIRSFFQGRAPEAFIDRLVERSQAMRVLNQREAKKQLDPLLAKLNEMLEQHKILQQQIAELNVQTDYAYLAYRSQTATAFVQKQVQLASLDERILDTLEEVSVLPFIAQHQRPRPSDVPPNLEFGSQHMAGGFIVNTGFLVGIVSNAISAFAFSGIKPSTGSLITMAFLSAFSVAMGNELRKSIQSHFSHKALKRFEKQLPELYERFREQIAQRCEPALTGVRVGTLEEEIPVEWNENELEEMQAEPLQARKASR